MAETTRAPGEGRGTAATTSLTTTVAQRQPSGCRRERVKRWCRRVRAVEGARWAASLAKHTNKHTTEGRALSQLPTERGRWVAAGQAAP